MSLSSLFVMLLVWGSYSLGKFNAERPGEAWSVLLRCWQFVATHWFESSGREK